MPYYVRRLLYQSEKISWRRPNGPEVTTITANKNKGEVAYENEDETLFEHPLEHHAGACDGAGIDAEDEYEGAGGDII